MRNRRRKVAHWNARRILNYSEAHRDSKERNFSREGRTSFLSQDSLCGRSSTNLWTFSATGQPQREKRQYNESWGLHWLVSGPDLAIQSERTTGSAPSWRGDNWAQNSKQMLAPPSGSKLSSRQHKACWQLQTYWVYIQTWDQKPPWTSREIKVQVIEIIHYHTIKPLLPCWVK